MPEHEFAVSDFAVDGIRGDGRQQGITVQRVQPAYRQVADQLRAQILSGELPPGSRLPNETELSALFGVSRSTIREGLRVLSSQDLVTTSRGVGGGTFVSRPELHDVAAYLEASLGLLSTGDAVSVGELLEFRRILEVPATGLAAQRRSEDDLVLLREVLALEPDLEPTKWSYETHRAFHQTLLDTCGNPLVEMTARPIFNTLRTRFLRRSAPAGFAAQVHEDHVQIFRAVEAGDSGAAQDAMESHLHALAQTYLAIDRRTRDSQGAGAVNS
jgi:DNA-binding FadR family transcriptional regulator